MSALTDLKARLHSWESCGLEAVANDAIAEIERLERERESIRPIAAQAISLLRIHATDDNGNIRPSAQRAIDELAVISGDHVERMVLEAIRQPTARQWRTGDPAESGWYLVTTKLGEESIPSVERDYFGENWYGQRRVIAYMPLPEPWKEGE